MKKVFLALLLLPATYSTTFGTNLDNDHCQTIRMPKPEVLKQKLQTAGFGYFDEKTKISEQLGNQEKHPLGVAMAVELSLYDFNNEYMVNSQTIAALMQMNKPILIKTLLSNHPDAIECLENMHLLEKDVESDPQE